MGAAGMGGLVSYAPRPAGGCCPGPIPGFWIADGPDSLCGARGVAGHQLPKRVLGPIEVPDSGPDSGRIRYRRRTNLTFS